MSKPGRKPSKTVAAIDEQIAALTKLRDELMMVEGRKVVDAAYAAGLLDMKLPVAALKEAFAEMVSRFQSAPKEPAKTAGKADRGATAAETRRVG